jgi:hypothetical protein
MRLRSAVFTSVPDLLLEGVSPLIDEAVGNGVGKTEGDELWDFAAVEVRQVTATVPAVRPREAL